MAKWRPGKKDTAVSTVAFQTRVTPEEREQYEAMAAYHRVSVAEYLRRLLEEDLVRFKASGKRLPRSK